MASRATTTKVASPSLWPRIGAATGGRAVSLGVGLGWTALLLWRLHGIPSVLWRWRDDAVITLSHAYGLVHLGTVSVSSTGSRVEGFSSPLEFAVGVVYFLFGGHSYQRLLDGQIVLCALIVGYSIHRLAHHLCIREPEGMLLASAAGFVTFLPWPSVGWFSSGMENSLGFEFLALSANLWIALRRGKGRPESAACAIAALGLVRDELPVLLLPVVALFCLDAGRARGWRRASSSLAIILGTWSAVSFARLIYFGSLVPNTAVVQDKVAIHGARSWLWVLVAAIAFSTLWAGTTLAAVVRREPRAARDLSVVLLLGLVPLLQLGLLGPARLDGLRVASMSALPSAVVFCFGLWFLDGPRIPPSRVSRRIAVAGGSIAVALLFTHFDAQIAGAERATELCCDMSPSASLILQAADDQARATNIPRAIAANPDLGKLSFTKKVAVVDLGQLGDPLLTLVRTKMPGLTLTYLTRVVTPDVVELHRGWSCDYTDWATSRFFTRNYHKYPRSIASSGSYPHCVNNGTYTIWLRNLRSSGYRAEVKLTREIHRSRNPVPLVRASIRRCSAERSGDVFRCEWVTRALDRNLTELDRHHQVAAVLRALDGSPSLSLDSALLRSRDLPDWWHAAFEKLQLLAAR